jgi:hypothetical protein
MHVHRILRNTAKRICDRVCSVERCSDTLIGIENFILGNEQPNTDLPSPMRGIDRTAQNVRWPTCGTLT